MHAVKTKKAVRRKLRRPTPSQLLGNIVVYGFLLILFIVTFFPFWHIFMQSLNDAGDPTYGKLMLWPSSFTLDSYKAVLQDQEIIHSLGITVSRVLVGVPITVACVSMLAYALSKRELPGWRGVNLFFVFTMYFSGGLIPTYMVIRSLHLIDSFWVFIFPGVVNVFWMILVRTYMEGLPKEMMEVSHRHRCIL